MSDPDGYEVRRFSRIGEQRNEILARLGIQDAEKFARDAWNTFQLHLDLHSEHTTDPQKRVFGAVCDTVLAAYMLGREGGTTDA